MAEFALVLPIFLVLVFAIVDFGMGLNAWITVTNSAREGARLGAVHSPTDNPSSPCYGKSSRTQCIVDRVRATTCPDADPACLSKLTPPPTVTNAEGTPGESVTVEVHYQYSFITPLSSLMGFISGGSIGPNLNISSTADMRLE